MPVLNPNTPPVLAGGADVYVAALNWSGQTWMIPSALTYVPTTLYASELLDGPPPVTPLFTPFDLESSLIPYNFLNVQQLNPRQWDLVKAYLYAQHVSATGVEPPPPNAPPETPPTDYVEPEPPDPRYDTLHQVAKLVREVIERQKWQASQLPTREFLYGTLLTLEGNGHRSFASMSTPDNEYSVMPEGIAYGVQAHPDWEGTSPGGSDALHYGLGDLSLGTDGYHLHPVKMMHLSGLIFPGIPRVAHIKYNLRVGVSILVQPLYPVQFVGDIFE